MRRAIFPVLLGLAVFSHCVSPPSKPHPTTNYQAVNAVLSSKSIFAEGSLYACILNLYYQGIPLKQAGEECALKLLDADQKGLFVEDDKVVIDTPTGKVGPGAKQYYDPYQVQAACGHGDPRIGQSSSGVGKWPGKGEYTWGGDPQHFHGYSKEDSFKMKEQAVKEAEQAKKDFWDAHDKAEEAKKALDEAKKALEEAKKKGDEEAQKKADEAVKKAQEKYDEAYKKAQDKAADSIEKGKKAEEDPNKKQKGSSRTVEGETPCEQALQAARELLWECHRTNWRAFECQQLNAKMNHCPDPSLILVDPEQGYACGEKIDKEALKNAYVARCEQLKRYNPEGPNPCQPPTVDNPGRYLKGKGIPNACEPDPQSYVNPHDDSCITEVEIQPFGEPDLQKILVYGLNKFGGPVVVIPPKDPDPPPKPGPGPDPGPGE